MEPEDSAGGLVQRYISAEYLRQALPKFRVDVYSTDAVVHVLKHGSQSWEHQRGVVKEFSDNSRRRLLFAAYNAAAEWRSFSTLTYPREFPTDGRTVKEHLHLFLDSLHYHFGDVSWLWALEFQARGSPHYHLLASQFIPKEWLSQRWYEVVGSGDSRHLRAGTSIESCSGRKQGAAYMVKIYGAKKFQKTVPEDFSNVGRFWGVSRGLVVPLHTVELQREDMNIVRTLRKYTESQLKPKSRRPERDGKRRSRRVERRPSLANLHTGLNGFQAFNGAPVAARLLEERAAEW